MHPVDAPGIYGQGRSSLCLEPLVSVLTDFDPTLVVCCFNVFVGCVSVDNHGVVIMQGLEQLATVSA